MIHTLQLLTQLMTSRGCLNVFLAARILTVSTRTMEDFLLPTFRDISGTTVGSAHVVVRVCSNIVVLTFKTFKNLGFVSIGP